MTSGPGSAVLVANRTGSNRVVDVAGVRVDSDGLLKDLPTLGKLIHLEQRSSPKKALLSLIFDWVRAKKLAKPLDQLSSLVEGSLALAHIASP